MIWSSLLPISYFLLSVLANIVWSNIVSNVDASIGENVVVSPVNPDTPVPAFLNATDIVLAIETLPNGWNPAGCTAFFNSLT